MRSRSLLLIPLFAALVPGAGCSPKQEYNSTETVKTAPVAVPPRPAKVNKPESTPIRGASTKPID